MFCAVYDKLGALPDHEAKILQFALAHGARPGSAWTQDKANARRDQFLAIVNYRYTLYLDLLVSVQRDPSETKETWPLPPWFVRKSIARNGKMANVEGMLRL
jgi:hypothetical protein